jgi:phosphoglycolate phosphatase-like HAD superfamily hydrolase
MTDVVALDFDGVLCDSARETGASAWRAGCSLWKAWEGDVPRAFIDRFVELRPLIETGFQTILLMKMIADGVGTTDIKARFGECCQAIIDEEELTREELVGLFGRTRDRWIETCPEEWLELHRFYPGVIEALRESMRKGPVYIVTTKQERFVSLLLDAVGVAFPSDHIYGLDRGMKKEEVLRLLLAEHGARSSRIHFVEDRLDTLIRVTTCRDLAAVSLYFAEWGYARPEDSREARACSRITVWGLGDFLVL